jgi:hypothetical protein
MLNGLSRSVAAKIVLAPARVAGDPLGFAVAVDQCDGVGAKRFARPAPVLDHMTDAKRS